jgi:uncharacterized protein (TIGR02996 family)
MIDERAFLMAILEEPDDDTKELVYADWLEERGDPRAEYLRLMMKVRQERVVTEEQRARHEELSAELAELRTQEMHAVMAGFRSRRSSQANRERQRRAREVERHLAELSEQIRQHEVPPRLQELAATFDPNWLAIVSDTEIEGCGKSSTEGWLRFDFVCDKTWADLKPTEEQTIRHCEACRKNVFFCDNLADAREHAEENHCIAVDLGIIRRDGDLEPQIEIDRLAMAIFGGPSRIEPTREDYERNLDTVSKARLDAKKQGSKKQRVVDAMMIHLEPLGTDVILPAFVIGYELPLPKGHPDHLPSLPRWIVTIDQQAGGMCMSYPSVVGAVLRLEANLERGKKNLAHLVRGLKCMAEDPKIGVLKRDYPALSRLVATWGTEYTKDQLRDLENVLSANVWMPPLRNGIEAFIRCAECDPLAYFRGWRMLGCAIREGADSRRGSVYSLDESHCYYVDDSNLSDLVLTDEDEFGPEVISVLEKVPLECGTTTRPSVFFLWENAD